MELLVGLAVGAGVFYVWVWRRWQFIGAYRSRQAFEQQVREARESATGPSPYRIATDEDEDLLDLVGALQQELEALGFREIGALVLEREAKGREGKERETALLMVTRLLVSGDGKAIAGVSVTSKYPARRLVAVSSYTGEQQITTRRGYVPSLAVPPFVEITSLPPETPMRELLAAHRVPDDARPIHTIDDALARLVELRERTLAWRASLSPDELLDVDLRGLLGKQYETTGKLWAARLRDKIPRATARRV